MKSVSGYASVRTQYDRHGRIKQRRYFDESLIRPKIIDDNTAGVEYVYDDNNKPVELKYLDSKPGVLREKRKKIGGEYVNTYARAQYTYDTRGNKLAEAYYGADGKLKVSPDNICARFVMEYDASGRLTAESCYGANNTLIVASPGGYMKATYTYDARGYEVETRYLGPNDQPARIWADRRFDGQFMTKSQNDRFGNLIKEQYYDEKGNRIPGYSRFGERCFLWTATYNYQGNMEPARGKCLQK